MALKVFQIILLYVIGIAVTKVASNEVLIKSLDVETKPNNDYFGNISSKIKNVNKKTSSIFVNLPIKKDLDQKLQVKLDLNLNKMPILKDYIVNVCDSLSSNDQLFEDVLNKIEPANKFPSKCPIPAGDWTINNYVMNLNKFTLFGLSPSGDFDLEAEIGMPNSEPLIKILVIGTISSSNPLSSLFKLI